LAQYLIDSHIFLWAIDAPERLLVPERKLLCDVANDVAVSVASFWELSIKFSKGLLPLGPGKAPVSGDDRILIAQALIGGRAMITRDTVFSHYPGLQVFTP
jgi:PIN domain nuclease of toxin-antitoxin system